MHLFHQPTMFSFRSCCNQEAWLLEWFQLLVVSLSCVWQNSADNHTFSLQKRDLPYLQKIFIQLPASLQASVLYLSYSISAIIPDVFIYSILYLSWSISAIIPDAFIHRTHPLHLVCPLHLEQDMGGDSSTWSKLSQHNQPCQGHKWSVRPVLHSQSSCWDSMMERLLTDCIVTNLCLTQWKCWHLLFRYL